MFQQKMNYLDKIPCHNTSWSQSENSLITLEIKNKGVFSKITQVIFKKPPVYYVHLDQFGSFIWKNIDGEISVYDISKLLTQEFGELAEPLFLRLVKFFKTLENNNFITWKL